MKLTKKLLSVLLAVLMITSSMSVCFGTFTFTASAAWEEYTEDPEDFLAYALNSATVEKYVKANTIGNAGYAGKNASKDAYYTTTIVTDNYADYLELRDIVVYIHKAILNTSNYKKVDQTSDNADGNCTTFTGIKSDLITTINNIEPLSDAGKSFINYLLADDLAVKHGDNNTTKQNNAVTNTLNIQTTDIKGYLKTVAEGDYTTIGNYENKTSYYLKMIGKNGSSNLGYKPDCTQYYHHYMWGANWKAENYPPTTSSAAANTDLNNYANYVNNLVNTNTFDVMATKTLAEIEALESNVDIETNTIKSKIADAGEGEQDKKYDQLFPGFKTKIDEWKKIAADAKDLATYAGIVNDLAAYQAANAGYGVFNYGGFDEATVKADYADFMNTFGSLINNKTVYDYFVGQGKIDDTYVSNFRDNKVVYDLRDTIEKADALYAEYEYGAVNPDIDGEEEDALKVQADASALTGYINAYNSYTAQVKNAIRADINYLLQLQEKFECTISACIVYFAERVAKDYSDVETQLVKDEITTAKNQLAALTALAGTVDFEVNATYLAEPFANADTFIAYLYQVLADRFTAQVENADEAFTSIGRPTEKLSLAQFAAINSYIAAVDNSIVEYLDGAGQGALVSQATRNTFATLQTEVIPAFEAFKIDRGFQSFKTEDILIRREDNSVEYFRKNADLDDDGVGEYEVTDENVAAIIDLLEGALKDPTIAKLLGDLINKDKETGEPTGEPFSLSALVTNLLNESVYTDSLVNTIVQYVYPLVCKEFAKVWAGLPATLTIEDVKATDSITADVTANLSLDDVETAIGKVGIYLSPKKLAERLSNAYPAYTQVINTLNKATTAPVYYLNGEGDADDTFDDPWADGALFTNKLDKEGNVVYDEETGRPVKVYALNWGIDSATNKKAAFVDAMCAALSGLEPLLFALLANQSYENADVTSGDCRGVKIGTGSGSAKVSFISLNLTIDPISLVFRCSGNDGWDNALVPLFEALGLTNIPHSEELTTTRKFLENGLLAMIEQLIAKLDANPIEFLLDALPNLAYMFEAGMIEPLLHQLKTDITYAADAYYSVNAVITTITGNMLDAMKAEEPIKINIGEMINLKDMGLDISNFAAIWNMIAGGVELLAGVEAPNAAYIATLGTLTEINSNRSDKGYTGGTANKAYYIDANRADVLAYLIQWVLESGLLGGLVKEPSELIATIFANLENNSSDTIAAIVELLNQKAYPAKDYTWLEGNVVDSDLGKSALKIYLNPENDWTPEKAQYLYDHLEAILTAALTMAGVELDLEATVADLVNGLLTDETLTSLATILAKLDLNALLAGDKAEEGEETPDANEPETVEEGEETEAAAPAIDVNALVKEYLGLDLAAIAAQYAEIAAKVEETKDSDEKYVHNFGVNDGTTTFAAALAEMLKPLSMVLDFILEGGNITLTIGGETVTLLGAKGYENGIVPLLEALGCEVEKNPEDALAATINAIVGKIEALTTNTEENAKDGVIYGIIDMLPGLLYYIASNGLATSILNLLQPVLTIVDTIRPVFDVMGLINGLEIGEADENGAKKTLAEVLGGELNLAKLDLNFIFNLVNGLVGLDLSDLKFVIYDACASLETTYTSASSLIAANGKKGAYKADFTQADLLTVVLSFVLDWASDAENGAALDELLGTNGIIASLGTVFADVKIEYGTPNWSYVFKSEKEFGEYLASEEGTLPNKTLPALTYPNDWDDAAASYFGNNLATLIDIVIGMINTDENAPKTLAALLKGVVDGATGDIFTADTINSILGMLQGVLANIDDTLLDLGYLLDLDIVGLKNYTCTKEINDLDSFLAEIGFILDEYAKPLVDLLFFGDDIRLAAKKVDGNKVDTIVINGGLGYEKGLALILEALGCDVPAVADATVTTVLASVAARVDEILAAPVDEIVELLPNLVYFLNANGLGVAVDNMLQPVYALLDKINGLGILEESIVIADLLKFKKTNEAGEEEEVVINLEALSLEYILNLVEELTGLDLTAAEKILVNLCYGKLEKATYGYKMVTDAKDTITVILTTAFALISDEEFSAKLAEMTGLEVLASINTVFAYGEVAYLEAEWDYCWDANGEATGETIPVIDSNLEYTTDWDAELAAYIANNLPALVDTVVGMVSEDATLGALLQKVLADANIFTTETLQGLINTIAGLLGDIDSTLLEAGVLVDVDVNGLAAHEVAAEIDTVEEFAAELATILTEYAKGIVEWLLLGKDFKFFVTEDTTSDTGLHDVIVLNGAHGYANGLALLLEALGCKGLPTVDFENAANNDTAAIVAGVLASLADRIDAIVANPVEEVLNMLPNILYFLNSNGVAVAVNNLAAAPLALLEKLAAFGIELDINDLINIEKLVGVEEDLAIGVDNLTLAAILELVGAMTGLDLSVLETVLGGFALGHVEKYDSVSEYDAYKMVYDDEFDKKDMITVLLASVLLVVFETEGNDEVINEMVGMEVITAIENIFNPKAPVYSEVPEYDYTGVQGIVGEVITTNIEKYPTDWSEEKAEWVATKLPVIVDAIVALVKSNDEATLGTVLAEVLADANIFNSENLEMIVHALADLLGGIDTGLLEIADLLLNVDVTALAEYKAPADIATLEAFAGELANILTTYASGIIEWFFLGRDYTFFVKDVDESNMPVNFITIRGTKGYAEGLALILEAFGCKNLPAAGSTAEIVAGVFTSIAARIDEIIADPINELVDMLPGVIYFLNANGLAVVVDNLTAGLVGILAELDTFGVTNVEDATLADLIDLGELLETQSGLSIDNLSLAAVIDFAAEKLGINLTAVKEVFVNYQIGEVYAYDSVSEGNHYKMSFSADEEKAAKQKADFLTAVLVSVLLTAFDEEYGNKGLLKEMIGEDIVNAIETVINDAEVVYGTPDWYYCADANGDATGETIPVIDSAITYPNDWNEEAVGYLADNLPELVDAVVALVAGEGETLSKILTDNVNFFTTETLEELLGMLQGLGLDAYETLLDAGMLLDIDINGLLKHDVTKGITTVDAFAAEVAYILSTYFEGFIDWLLLGDDFTLFYKGYDEDKNPTAYITINGAHGYANGIALILEALGCKGLPTVDFENAANNDTAAIVAGVFASIADRIDEIFANPVEEIVDLLPNLIYFINTNGVSVAVNNMIAAVSTLLVKLKVFGVTNKDGGAITLADLVDLKDLLGLADTDATISVNNLTLKSILEAVGLLVDLDLTVLEDVLGGFALGKLEKYETVSNLDARKMVYGNKLDRKNMITVVLTAVITTVFNDGMNENGKKLDKMLGTNLITALEEVFNGAVVEYGAPTWKYVLGDNTSLDAVIHQIQNPNNWTAEDAAYLADELPEAVDIIVRQLTDAENLSELLAGVLADTNIFTADTLQGIIDMLVELLAGIDEGLVEVAGLTLDLDINGLKKHKVAEINSIAGFAAELAKILNYADGIIEWLLLGRDYEFFVKNSKNYDTVVNFITVKGGQGYAEGLALILEALGCENLPAADLSTEEIIAGVLASIAARIDAIIADPVNEIIDLLPNILYFINTNGLAVAVNNLAAPITGLLAKLKVLGVTNKDGEALRLVDIVDLKAILGLPETALISMDNLTMEALLEIVSFIDINVVNQETGKEEIQHIDITHIKNILVNFALGQLVAYDAVNGKEAYKMIYRDADKAVADGYTAKYMIDRGEMFTVIANAAIMVLEDEDNFDIFFNLLGEKAMTVILSLFNFGEPQAKAIEWLYVNPDGSYDADKIYSGFTGSENYDKNAVYGELYTKEQAQYIAENFPDFIDNMVYLIGIDGNGDGINDETLEDLINSLLNGGLYNTTNAVAIRDALYKVLNDAIGGIKVSGIAVGPYIKMILKLSKIADIDGIAKVEIADFEQDRAAFVAAICDILEPIYPVLRFVLADEDFRFFTTYDEETGKPTDAITLRGAEGYAYGIIPLLEVLGCKADDILTPDEYYAAIAGGNSDVLLTSILNPLLNRVDVILADPAGEVLNMLPNLIYFINSKGLDTVVQNTLSAVFAVLNAIKPVKEIDLYAAVENATGLNVAEVDFEALVEFVLGLLNKSGYTFTVEDVAALSDLAVGRLESYESKNGNTAYRMVYVDGISGGKTEMVNIIEGLVITFITDEKNQAMVVKFLEEKLGMSESGKEFAEGTIEVLAGALQTELGMQAALTAVYYIYYGLDVGADSTVGGLTDINKIWQESLESIKNNVPGMGDVIDDILDLDALDGIISEEGLAPKGLAKFFAKITETFQKIGNFFKNLFSFSFLKK